jgi:hypothetical protein
MDVRERRPDEREWARPDPAAGEGDTGALDVARAAGERFLRAGDQAIELALSGNSEAFLRSSRQEGGE